MYFELKIIESFLSFIDLTNFNTHADTKTNNEFILMRLISVVID